MSRRTMLTPRRILLVIGALVLLWATAVAVTGMQAARALQTVAASAESVVDSSSSGRWPEASDQARRFADEARKADGATQRWPWALASRVPLLGDQLEAVTGASAAAHTVAQAVPGAVKELRELEEGGLVSEDGEIDLDAVQRLAPLTEDLSQRAATARAQLDDAQNGHLLPSLRSRLEQASTQISRADETLASAAALVPVLPAILGAEGPRQYLVAFTNPTEVRPVQGIVGAYAVLAVEDGRLSLAAAGTDNDLYRFHADPNALGPDYVARYGMDPALVQNVTLSADASDAARLLSDLWVDSGRHRPDGVLFLDPVGVSQMLADHPPLNVPGVGDVPVDRLPQLLLHDAYVRFDDDQDARKAFLTAVTVASFAAVLEEGIDRAVVEGAADAVQDGHLIVYSDHPQEQSALTELGAAGVLPAPSGEARIYLTNADPSKLDYWLHGRAELQTPCSAGDPTRISLRLQNDVPDDVPEYMRRVAADPATARTARRVVALYLPPGVEIVGADLDGRPVGLADRAEKGWHVKLATVDVAPSGASTLTWYVKESGGPALTSVELQPILNTGGETSVPSCS